MVQQFRTRKDGRHFPVGGGKAGGVNLERLRNQTKAFEKTVAGQLHNTHNNLAITNEGKIKKGARPAIEGQKDQKDEAKAVLEVESGMVKEIKQVDNKTHPTKGELERERADIKNLKVIHPELADKALEG